MKKKPNIEKAKTLKEFIDITGISMELDLLYLLRIGYKVSIALEKELQG